MNTRPLVLSFATAAALVAAVMLLAVLLPAPESSRGAVVKPALAGPTKLSKPAARPSFTLAPATGKPSRKSVKAHASAGYLHVLNCWYALNGANGDNDVLAWMYSHTPYGLDASGWGGSSRYDAHHVVVWVDYYRNGRWITKQPGYCVGSDSDIVDKVGSPPRAW